MSEVTEKSLRQLFYDGDKKNQADNDDVLMVQNITTPTPENSKMIRQEHFLHPSTTKPLDEIDIATSSLILLSGSGETKTAHKISSDVLLPYLNNVPKSPQGEGTEASPFLIETFGNLLWMSEHYTDIGVSENTYFLQTRNIDASYSRELDSGKGFLPICSSVSYRFSGIYDGGGYSIIGLYINRPESSYAGLFGLMNSTGVVKNIIAENFFIRADSCAGAITGMSLGSIQSCGAVNLNASTYKSSSSRLGGIVGIVSGSAVIENCFAKNITLSGNQKVGGIVGDILAVTVSVTSCYVKKGFLSGDSHVGGLSGNGRGIVSFCHTNIEVRARYYGGGLFGFTLSPSVCQCYSAGKVTTLIENRCGGLAENSFTGSDCFWDIDSSGITTSGGGTGLSIYDMCIVSDNPLYNKFVEANWDFTTVWEIDKFGINDGYPILRSLKGSY